MLKSMMKRTMLLSVVVGLLFVNFWGFAQGDLIDHLPEIQMARAIAEAVAFQNLESQNPLDDPEIAEICATEPTLEDIPNQLWLNNMGQLRTADEVRRVLILTQCSFVFLEGNQEEQDSSFLLGLLGGQDKTLGENIIIPGSKQPVRVVLAFSTFITMFFELVFSSLPEIENDQILLGEAPCETLSSLAVEGKSLELRWAAFMALVFDRVSIEAGEFSICGAPSEASNDELLAHAQQGNLDAAVELAFNWLSEVSDSDSNVNIRPEEAQAVIERHELFILNQFGQSLATMAAVVPIFILLINI